MGQRDFYKFYYIISTTWCDNECDYYSFKPVWAILSNPTCGDL